MGASNCRPVLFACAFGWLALATLAAAEAPRELEQVADGVFVLLQPENERFDDANSVVVQGEKDVLVVDPPSGTAANAALIAGIRARTELPVRFIVNTHWHGDHTEGNAALVAAFGPGVTIVGHHSLATEVPERAAAAHRERLEYYESALPQARAQLVDGLKRDGSPLGEKDRAAIEAGIVRGETWVKEHGAADFVSPTLSYESRLLVYRGSRRIELHHFRGHTAGDTVVFLPEERVLISGDLLDELPFVGHGYPSEWIVALETLAGLDFDIVVPGHGPLFGRELLERITAYARDLTARVRTAVEAGASLEEATESVDLSAWREALGRDEVARRFFDGVRAEAIGRVWAEITAELGEERDDPGE